MVKVAVVTGSNKGIGFSIVKALLQKFNGVVYLTSRDEERGRAAVAKLIELGLKPEFHQLDVTDTESVIKFRDHIKEKYGGIDILVNNAAVISNSTSYEACKEVIDINYYSILTVHEQLHPLVRDNGRILNISSDCGHLSNIRNEYWIQRLSRKDLTVNDINEFVTWFLDGVKNGTFNFDDLADGHFVAPYKVAKVAFTAVTKIQQKELEGRNISVNALHPGWVQTDMTLGTGRINIDQAAVTPLHLLLEAPETLKGAYIWHDGKEVDWYDYKGNYYSKFSSLNINI